MIIKNENDIEYIKYWLSRTNIARDESHKILSLHEQSVSRVVILEDLLEKLRDLPVDVHDYFSEAITCLENNLLRAAVVLSWAGFFHVLLEKVYLEHESNLRKIRTKWKFNSIAELKENYVEYQLLDVIYELKKISKSELRVYQGQLAERNRCAHPTLYRPSLNSALGFVDSMLRQTINYL